jgi:hypothetical protein
MPFDLEDEIVNIFNREIARELLLELDPDTNDALVDKLLAISPNPWDVQILYAMLKIKQEAC